MIDDDVSIREALTSLLQSYGYDILAFASANDFMEMGARDAFACLLIDMYMPGMTGLELLGRLNAMNTASRAILMSSEGGSDLKLAALRLGAHDFVEKSLGFDKLMEAVDQVVSHAP